MILREKREAAAKADRAGTEMREVGLEQAIQAAGGVTARGRAADIAQPFGAVNDASVPAASAADDIDLLRAHEYDLLAVLLGRAPTRDVLDRLSGLKGDGSPLGLAHLALAEAAATVDP